jgi:site-specific DNA-methyltransferase (adenine-specific)
MKIDLIHGDCLEEMKKIPDGSVDLVLTDPPYGLNIEYSQYEDTEENLQFLVDKFIPEARRIAKRVVVFPGINNIWKYPKADWVACWFYGTTGSWGKIGYNSWQPMLFYGKNNRRYGLDTIKYSKMEKRYPGHPCSKPLGLMEQLVARFSDEREIVLDCFMGTGSTGVACKKLNRNFIGIELDETYFNIAKERISST